jgi:hypothetical protein
MLVISGLFMFRRTTMGWDIRQRHFQVTKKRKKSRTGKKDKEDKDNKHYWGYKEHKDILSFFVESSWDGQGWSRAQTRESMQVHCQRHRIKVIDFYQLWHRADTM